jgi:predicted small secreted protein
MNFNNLIESILNESKHTYTDIRISNVEKNRKGKVFVTFYKMKIDGHWVELSDSHEPGKYETLGDYYFVGSGAVYFINNYSNEEYEEILDGAKKAVEIWKFKQKLTPETRNTFNDLIDII